MEVEINPITLETTKRLGRLYPSPEGFPESSDAGEGSSSTLDALFAADFLPAAGRRGGAESYGSKYVRYLHEFAGDQARHGGELEAAMAQELGERAQWAQEARERMLAQAVLVQAGVEAGRLDARTGARLAAAFAGSRLAAQLWHLVQRHVAGGGDAARADDLEAGVELLYLFLSWTEPDPEPRAPDAAVVQRVAAAVQLFVRYARHGADAGRVQRVRLGHKALLLLEAAWRLLVGDEARARARIGDNGAGAGRVMAGARGLARDALRQMRLAADKHPALAADTQADAERLLPLVHPFDGHLTRTALLDRFGPIRARRAELPPEPSDDARRWGARAVPRAARDAVAASVAAVRATRSEREYGEWWRRLVAERGMPLSLTLGAAPGRRGASDITVNYDGARRVGGQHEFCGIVEAEDLPALERHLDGHVPAWPARTAPERDAPAFAALYRALFPLLPALARALVLTVANWAPAERELPARPFLAGVGAPLASDATCLGVVKYPRCAPAREPDMPLPGSNVKRLGSSRARPATPADADVPAEVAARLLAQYAQWRAAGALLMVVLTGLQAGHVLQADYFAQLLMNENIIPALFWWLGSADLELCIHVPPPLRAHSFTAVFSASAASAGSAVSAAPAVSAGPAVSEAHTPCAPALHGIRDCMRALRRLTSHNGLRKGLLYKNKALYFYGRLLRVPCAPVQRIAAELVRDLMPVVSRRQKHAMLDTIAQVYYHAPVSLGDAFWLADYALDPQIEMHRHVELLRLLHFYHHQEFGLRLPRDPALFPSLASQAVDVSVPRVRPAAASAAEPAKCRHAGALLGEHSWLLWDSELEDALSDVYLPRVESI
ncbi:hypothetical protein IWW52_000959 [Coemansia sp. RSA 2704]|nr:hypothetical protein IWW52_000959 [Coemansia sp. RSA 2704]